jgi:hypothetical protein
MYQPSSLVSQTFHAWLNDTYGDLIETGELKYNHILEATEDIIAMVIKESQWLKLNPAAVANAEDGIIV